MTGFQCKIRVMSVRKSPPSPRPLGNRRSSLPEYSGWGLQHDRAAKGVLDISTRGWNSPANKPYKPLGELANVSKGCRVLRQMLRKFNLEVEQPAPGRKCKFLEGQDQMLDFVRNATEEQQATRPAVIVQERSKIPKEHPNSRQQKRKESQISAGEQQRRTTFASLRLRHSMEAEYVSERSRG